MAITMLPVDCMASTHPIIIYQMIPVNTEMIHFYGDDLMQPNPITLSTRIICNNNIILRDGFYIKQEEEGIFIMYSYLNLF